MFVRQPSGIQRIALVGRSRHSRLAKKGREPSLAHIDRLEVLTAAALGWQAHGEAGVKERNRQITRVAGFMARARIGGKYGVAALGAIFASPRKSVDPGAAFLLFYAG